jgi:glycerate 2-kinase
MNVLIASDKFKDACNAAQVGAFLSKGIVRTFPQAKINVIPLADGGEGTLDALSSSLNADWVTTPTVNPLFREIEATYLFQASEKRAIIEMSRASGFELLKAEERNCMYTSSQGTGIQILDAINKGAKEIVLTVGGTATNEAGMGVAHALGVRFYDKQKNELRPIGENLIKVDHIDFSNNLFPSQSCRLKIATDVENPFFGQKGAVYVFAKQKGANDQEIELLDAGLRNFNRVLEHQGFRSTSLIKGSGAGGGIAGGLFSLFNAEIFSAADWVLEVNEIEKVLENTDVLITGEGKVDSQTWDGKLLSRLLQMANKSKTKSIIICGTLENIEQIPQDLGIINVSSIIHKPISLEIALVNTLDMIEKHGMLIGHFLKNIEQ